MLTYTDIKDQFLRGIGQSGITNQVILDDFSFNLNERYQFILATLQNYTTQNSYTFSTVASQQYYSYPRSMVNVESVTVTIGSVQYVLTEITSQKVWNEMNAVTIQAGALPAYFFAKRDSFGIFPKPQAAYSTVVEYHIRDRKLQIEDDTTGTVALTNADATVTGTSTAFSASYEGLWFQVTSTDKSGWDEWYRISSYTSTTALELEDTWQASTITGANFRIGQVPEIPADGHSLLVEGTLADFYGGIKADPKMQMYYDNKFWTGSHMNPSRDLDDVRIKGGLIGLSNRYKSRNNAKIVYRNKTLGLAKTKVWGTTISSS